MNKFPIFVFILLLSFSFISAVEIGSDSPIAGVLVERPTLPVFNNNTAFVNASNRWITNIGILTNVNDTQFSSNGGLLTIETSWLNDIYCELTGCIMQGNFNLGNFNIEDVSNITILDTLFLEDVDHTIKIGSDVLTGTANEAINIHHSDEVEQGTILFLVTHQNNTNFWIQSGANNSAGGVRNSFIIFPDNDLNSTDKLNINITSNAVERWNRYGIDSFLTYDSLTNQTALGVQFGIETQKLFIHDDAGNGQVLMEGDFRVVAREGVDIDLYQGPVHIRDLNIKEFGLAQGQNITLISENFETGDLGIFNLITSGKGVSEWGEFTGPGCPPNGLFCAAAGPTGGSQPTVMQVNFSTTNLQNMTLNFTINTLDMAVGGDFEITVNNNSAGGVDETIFSLTGSDEFDSTITAELPTSMEDQSVVSLDVSFLSTHPIRGFVWIDIVLVNATATISTLANQTVQEGEIEFGDGSCRIDQNVIDSSGGTEMNITCNKINLIGNVTLIDVTELSLNVTNNVTANNFIARQGFEFQGTGERIIDWDDIPALVENILLANGSRPLTGQWNYGLPNINGSGNITTFGRLGIGTDNPNNLFEVANLISFDDTLFNALLGAGAGENLDDTGGGVDASRNLFIGFRAGAGDSGSNNTGSFNTAMGSSALRDVTTGTNNLALGTNALRAMTTGAFNIAIGVSALAAITTQTRNIAIGTSSFAGASFAGSENVGIGYITGLAATSANNNVFIGSRAGRRVTTGDGGIFIGFNAGARQTTASNLLIIDNVERADIATEATNAIIHGTMAATPANQVLTINANVGIGTTTPSSLLTTAQVAGTNEVNLSGVVYVNSTSGRVGIGTATPTSLLTVESGITRLRRGGSSHWIDLVDASDTIQWYLSETNAGDLNFGESGSADGRLYLEAGGNIGIGTTTPANTLNVVGDLNVTGTSYLGNLIIDADNITVNNIISKDGNITFYNSTSSEKVRFTNDGILLNNEILMKGIATRNLALGTSSTLNSITTGQDNIGFVQGALSSVTEGSRNFAMGRFAGEDLTTQNDNIFIGPESGRHVITSGNVAVGGFTLNTQVGGTGRNTAFGSASLKGESAVTKTGALNSAFGFDTGRFIDGGGGNVMLGYQAGRILTDGDFNIFIGHKAGIQQTTNSNLLIIDNQDRGNITNESTQALIYGQFNSDPDNQNLTFNANVGINGVPTTRKFEIFGDSNTASMRLIGDRGSGDVIVEMTAIDTAGEASLGTFSDHEFYLVTNNLRRLTADTNGNVGINTTAPTHTLNVVGDINFTGLPSEPTTATALFVCIETDGHIFLNETGCRT